VVLGPTMFFCSFKKRQSINYKIKHRKLVYISISGAEASDYYWHLLVCAKEMTSSQTQLNNVWWSILLRATTPPHLG